MEFAQEFLPAQLDYIKIKMNANHALLTVLNVLLRVFVKHALKDFNLMKCNGREPNILTVFKYVVMVKDSSLIAMMVIVEMVMDVTQIVKFKINGTVKEDLVSRLVHV